MITDAIISWFQQIVSFIVNTLPAAAIISGNACCAALMVNGLNDTISPVVGGGLAALSNSPISILIDWGQLGFVLGCLFAFLMAFVLIRILIQFWMLVKW